MASDHLDHLENDLLKSLSEICGQMEEICEQSGFMDPDQVMECIGEQKQAVESAVAQLLGALGDEDLQPADMNQAVMNVTDCLLAEKPKGLILRLRLQPNLPDLLVTQKHLEACLLRALSNTARYLSEPTELFLQTSWEKEQVLLTLSGHKNGSASNPYSLEDQLLSLQDILTEADGSLWVDEKNGLVEVSLCLPSQTTANLPFPPRS